MGAVRWMSPQRTFWHVIHSLFPFVAFVINFVAVTDSFISLLFSVNFFLP